MKNSKKFIIYLVVIICMFLINTQSVKAAKVTCAYYDSARNITAVVTVIDDRLPMVTMVINTTVGLGQGFNTTDDFINPDGGLKCADYIKHEYIAAQKGEKGLPGTPATSLFHPSSWRTGTKMALIPNSQYTDTTGADRPNETELPPIDTKPLECQDIFNNEFGRLLKSILKVMQYAAPLLVIILSTIDFVKAIVSQDKDMLKKASTLLIKRLILAAALFFISVILNILFSHVITGSDINCQLPK